jgi:hypothetical protein
MILCKDPGFKIIPVVENGTQFSFPAMSITKHVAIGRYFWEGGDIFTPHFIKASGINSGIQAIKMAGIHTLGRYEL